MTAINNDPNSDANDITSDPSDTVPNSDASKSDNCDKPKMRYHIKSKSEAKSKEYEKLQAEYAKSLLAAIDYTKMSGSEFYEGPGRSKFLEYEFKFEMIYKILAPK